MVRAIVLCVALAVPIALAACKSSNQPAPCKGCEMAKSSDGWCDGCSVGFKNGEKMACKGCHAAATSKGGWCEGCNKGYADGKPVACKGCATAAATGGTCPTCGK